MSKLSEPSPMIVIERLIAFRDSGKLNREERDLLADACNTISSLNWRLTQTAKAGDSE